MSTGRRIQLRGFALDKSGQRVIRGTKHLSVSKRLQAKASLRVRFKPEILEKQRAYKKAARRGNP